MPIAYNEDLPTDLFTGRCTTETKEQYDLRVGKLTESFSESYERVNATATRRANLIKEWKEMFDSTMFVQVEDADEAQEIIDNSGMKGIYGDFLVKLNSFYPEWKESNPDQNYVLALTGDGKPFGTKKVDTVYIGMTNALKSKELKSEWRVVKRTKDEVVTVYITKL